MAASAYLRRVSERTVQALLAEPARVKRVLFPSSSETVIDDEVLITLGEGFELIDAQLDRHAFLVAGGTPIGDESIGDGPARGVRSDEVRRLAARLAVVSVEDMRKQLARTPLPATAPSFDELLAMYGTLRDFVMTTAQAEAALIVYLG